MIKHVDSAKFVFIWKRDFRNDFNEFDNFIENHGLVEIQSDSVVNFPPSMPFQNLAFLGRALTILIKLKN